MEIGYVVPTALVQFFPGLKNCTKQGPPVTFQVKIKKGAWTHWTHGNVPFFFLLLLFLRRPVCKWFWNFWWLSWLCVKKRFGGWNSIRIWTTMSVENKNYVYAVAQTFCFIRYAYIVEERGTLFLRSSKARNH